MMNSAAIMGPMIWDRTGQDKTEMAGTAVSTGLGIA
jgi:hypothetical protein